jgi:hypothetical protein
MMITYRLMERFDEICKAEPSRAKLIIKAKVNKLLTDASGKASAACHAFPTTAARLPDCR